MNKYIFFVLAGFALAVAQTIIFGFETQGESLVEMYMSTGSIILIVWGIIGDVLRNVTWQKKISITVAKEDLSDTISSI